MKKIYINSTSHAIVFGGTMLLPGSNVCEEIDTKLFPMAAGLERSGDIEETKDTARAARLANTQKAADAVAELGKGDAKTKDAVSRRKKQLDEIDEQAKAARAAKKAEE